MLTPPDIVSLHLRFAFHCYACGSSLKANYSWQSRSSDLVDWYFEVFVQQS